MLSGNQLINWSNQQKTTLHVQHTFFVHFFAVVLHDYNVKLPEISQLDVLGRKCRSCSRSLFFSLPSICALLATAFLIFSPPLQIFHVACLSSPLFFISRSSSLSLFFWLSFSGLSLLSLFSVFLFLYIRNLWTWQLI